MYSVIYSTQSPLTGAFTGVANYETVLHTTAFWNSILRMVYFTALQVAVMLALALVLALFLDSRYCKGRRLFALVYFLPYAVPSVIAAIMWAFILSPTTNSLWRVVHVQPLTSSTVLYVIAAIVTWEWTGYNMTLYLASLTSVSSEVTDAGRIDGCGEIGLAWYLKLGLIRNVVIFTTITSVLGTFQLFNEPAIISSFFRLSPSYTPNFAIYNTAFFAGNIPLAAAESTVLAAITIVGGVAFAFIARRRAFTQRAHRGPAPGGG